MRNVPQLLSLTKVYEKAVKKDLEASLVVLRPLADKFPPRTDDWEAISSFVFPEGVNVLAAIGYARMIGCPSLEQQLGCLQQASVFIVSFAKMQVLLKERETRDQQVFIRCSGQPVDRSHWGREGS